MYYWRITKYDPAIRNEYGWYLKDEWTSVGEIGEVFEGIKLDKQTYLKTEASYINAILLIMSELNVTSMQIEEMQTYGFMRSRKLQDKGLRKFYRKIHTGMTLQKDEIVLFAKLALRRLAWGKLINDKMFIHFGDDYYMYAGTEEPIDKSIQSIHESGLFVEEFESPYLEVWDD